MVLLDKDGSLYEVVSIIHEENVNIVSIFFHSQAKETSKGQITLNLSSFQELNNIMSKLNEMDIVIEAKRIILERENK